MQSLEGARRAGVGAGGMTTETEGGVVWGCEPRNVDGLHKLEKATTKIFPQSFQKEYSPTSPFYTSELLDQKIINVHCFKVPGLW